MTTSEYTSYSVYTRRLPTEPFIHSSHEEKESALQVVRDLKAIYGEPTVDFVQSADADVLHFKFKGTGIIGQVVLSKREICERIHCPTCGVVLKRKEDDPVTTCHNWKCTWVFHTMSRIWRVGAMERELI